MSRHALLIINPASRAGRSAPTAIQQATHCLEGNGFRVKQVETEYAGHATDLASVPGFELVIAAGGDGTINETVTGLLRQSIPPKLAILPAGTGNDVARILGVNSSEKALDALNKPKNVRWDVIEIDCRGDRENRRRHALLFAGAGFVGDVIRQTTPRVKRYFGSTLSYSVAFLRALWMHQTKILRIRGPQFQFEGPVLVALAANATHAGGGGMHLGPGARMDDGEFNVSVIRSVTRFQVLGQFLRLTRGTHVNHPAVRYAPATWLEVDADESLDVIADGEIVGVTPLRLQIKPQAITLIAHPNS